uniref:F-box domain-containing protein n=1 Tax=Oryza punctata TaxID=4537 RepID=A0A0E0M577_ORYPU
MAKTSPLHNVIGAARWDAERPLGRILILAHAAFLNAGFVPAADGDENSVRLPRKVGRTASSLPLRYAAPQLLHWPESAAAVQLRLCAHGRHLVLYVSITRTSIFRKRRLDTYWVCLDALAAAALLAGGLDDTARALRRDARLAALWSALTDKLCRRVLVDMCAKYGVTLEPNFMSLPDDVKAAILARLPDGDDLARVECTCAGLRRLVADRDRAAALWKPMYEKLPFLLRLVRVDDDDEPTTEVSWKKKYAAARLWPLAAHFLSMRERRRRPIFALWFDLDMDSFTRFWAFNDTPEPLPEEMTVPRRRRRRRRRRAMPRDGTGHGHAALGHSGDKKPRHGAGAVHSPSSRFRWKHR